jgi:four helix bundle protein
MLELSHKNLEVYKVSLNLVNEVYELTKLFPKEEFYVLVSQLKRAAISTSSNIAEGAARRSKKEKQRFYEVARSSVVEVDTQFEIALLRKFIGTEECLKLSEYLISAFRMLSKMIDNLN